MAEKSDKSHSKGSVTHPKGATQQSQQTVAAKTTEDTSQTEATNSLKAEPSETTPFPEATTKPPPQTTIRTGNAYQGLLWLVAALALTLALWTLITQQNFIQNSTTAWTALQDDLKTQTQHANQALQAQIKNNSTQSHNAQAIQALQQSTLALDQTLNQTLVQLRQHQRILSSIEFKDYATIVNVQWLLLEAEMLLRLADVQAHIAQDIARAQTLLIRTRERLKLLTDNAFLKSPLAQIFETIEREIQVLEQATSPELAHWPAKIRALQTRIQKLPPRAAPIETTTVSSEDTLWQQLTQRLQHLVQIKIRQHRPQLTKAEHLVLQNHIILLLEQAQTALLIKDITHFQEALTTSAALLRSQLPEERPDLADIFETLNSANTLKIIHQRPELGETLAQVQALQHNLQLQLLESLHALNAQLPASPVQHANAEHKASEQSVPKPPPPKKSPKSQESTAKQKTTARTHDQEAPQ